jgi:hypothetical protein
MPSLRHGQSLLDIKPSNVLILDRIAVMEAQRQRIIGLAIVVLLILLFVIVRHLWSAA